MLRQRSPGEARLLMDLNSFIGDWRGEEVVAFCGPIKYRGTLEDILEGGFLVMSNVAIMMPSSQDTSEYRSCVLNVQEISGLAYREVVGRGGESDESF